MNTQSYGKSNTPFLILAIDTGRRGCLILIFGHKKFSIYSDHYFLLFLIRAKMIK